MNPLVWNAYVWNDHNILDLILDTETLTILMQNCYVDEEENIY